METMTPYIEGHDGDIYLFDVATHANLGDNLLWFGAKRIIRAFKRNPDIICAMSQRGKLYPTYPACPGAEKVAKTSAQRPVLILWTAGGNWGDIWPGCQTQRINYIKALEAAAAATPNANITVVQLPQSIHYIKSSAALRDKRILDALATVKFTLMHRSVHSAEVAREKLGDVERYTQLAPDFGFTAGPLFFHYPPAYDIVLLLRADKETTLSQTDCNNIARDFFSQPANSHLTWKLTNWQHFDNTSHTYHGTPADLADLRVEGIGYTLAPARVVITNRLHGTVSSLLLGKPTVFFDGARYAEYGKIFTTVSFALNTTQCSDWDRLQLFPIRGSPSASPPVTEQDILLRALEKAADIIRSLSDSQELKDELQ